MYFKKKAKRWICKCDRINDPDDSICAFCQQPKTEKPDKKSGKKQAYDQQYLWPVYSLYIRLRDTDFKGIGKCFTCPRLIFIKNGDCGHGHGRQHKGTKYNEQNNHLQCGSCNGFEGGMREVYKIEMDRRYGPGTWDKMELASKKVTKLGKVECDFLIAYYKKEIEKLLVNKSKEVNEFVISRLSKL